MTKTKPILTIKEKCPECKGYDRVIPCDLCKSIGTQTTNIYALRDLPKKVPFKDYKIKKVSEIQKEIKFDKSEYNQSIKFFWSLQEHNLNEYSKIVVTTE